MNDFQLLKAFNEREGEFWSMRTDDTPFQYILPSDVCILICSVATLSLVQKGQNESNKDVKSHRASLLRTKEDSRENNYGEWTIQMVNMVQLRKEESKYTSSH